MQQKHTIRIFLFIVLVIPFSVYGLVKWYQHRFTTLPVLGPKDHRVSYFKFSNQNGTETSLNDWSRKIVVAHFFFTHCPSICPKMMYQLKRVQAYAGPDVLLTSFSVDPERDSVARLKEYALQFAISGNWLLLTGDKKKLYRFARKDLFVTATDGDGGAGDFIHSDNLVLLDPRQRIRGYYKGTDPGEVNNLIHDIKKLRKELLY